ncbi:MAG: MogA/MoaB family molybdenum cofactor biosynthesis protein [Planctomycetota bacterium]|jgi:molybdenum cofactor synthesis domain-containing protein
MIKTAVLTISDSCSKGQREDISGRAIRDILTKNGFEVCEKRVVADDGEKIAAELIYFSDEANVDVLFTTGGTGLGPRDITPEATVSVCEKLIPGLSEMMRVEGFRKNQNAILSRGTAGIRKNTLIILGVLPHAVDMMLGGGH